MKRPWRQWATAYAMLAPALLLFTTFILLPAVLAVVIAFKRIDVTAGVMGSPWVGVQNFHDLFANVIYKERIQRAFANTLLFTVCFVPANLLMSIVIASLINGLGTKGQSFYRAAFYLPTVTSAIVFGMIWKWLYDTNYGLLNYVLESVGFDRIPWTGHPDWSMWSVIIASIAMGPGGNILIYLAALGSVPTEQVESARVEGANVLQSWWFVTLPHLRPVTLYLLVLNTIGSFQVFELVFVLTSGGPAGSSTVIVYEIYDLAFRQGRYGPAGALSLILVFVVCLLAALQFKMFGGNAEEASKRTILTRIAEFIGDTVGDFLGWVGRAASRIKFWPERAHNPEEHRKAWGDGNGSDHHIVTPTTDAWPPAGQSRMLRVLRAMPLHVALAPLALLFLTPMVWMFLSALTPDIYLQSVPPAVKPAHFSLENYQKLRETAPLMLRWFWNSAYLSLTVTLVQLCITALAGYVFARMVFPGRSALFALLIGSIMLPYQALVIPLFMVISSGIRGTFHVDLIDTHWAILLPAVISPVGIFLMRQYVQGLPRELEEAARIDGCGEFGVWRQVILPLCRPILGAWGILTFTGIWRSFFWPFVVLGTDQLFTLEVGLQTLQQQHGQSFGLVMAGATVSALPMILIFFIFQKQIVAGLTFGAVKG